MPFEIFLPEVERRALIQPYRLTCFLVSIYPLEDLCAYVTKKGVFWDGDAEQADGPRTMTRTSYIIFPPYYAHQLS